MTYPAVHQLIGRIAARTGIGFTAHVLRHSHVICTASDCVSYVSSAA
jgi:integrase